MSQSYWHRGQKQTPPAAKAQKIALFGTVISALLASACCWLPLLLLVFGVSGVAVSATFEQYRLLFIAVTFAFLAAGFYFVYRPKQRSVEGAATNCCPEPSGTKGWNLQKLNKAMLWVVTAVALGFVFFPNYVGVFVGSGESAVANPRAFPQVTLNVEGMHCEGCAPSVRAALEEVFGVKAASVGYESGKAVVSVDPESPASDEALVRAVEALGYKASKVPN